MRPGTAVYWRHTFRGGYGYTELIPGIVRRVGPKRVLVEVAHRDGATALRWVKPENLRPREAA